MYGDLKSMDFKAFAGCFYCYRYYSRHFRKNKDLDKWEFERILETHE